MNGRTIALIVFIIAAGLYFGYAQPAYTVTIAGLSSKIASDEAALAAAKQYSSRAASLDAQRSQIPSAYLSDAATALPSNVDNMQLVFDLDSLAARAGFTLTNFNIAAAPATASSGTGDNKKTAAVPYRSVDISVSARGTYASFRQFLNELEYSLRLVDVTELSVKSNPNMVGVYTYQMTLRTYWLPQ